MGFLKFGFVTQLVYCSLLIPIYLWTLWKSIRGQKFKLIVQITILLLISVFGYSLVLLSNWEQFLYDRKGHQTKLSAWIILDNVGVTIADLTFCEAHWIFAWYYFKVALNMTNTDPGQLEERAKALEIAYWIGVVFNAIFPICEGLFGGVLYYYYKIYKVDKKWAGALFNCSMIGTSVVQLITCTVYFYALIKMKQFIEKTSRDDQFDIKTMMIHASAYGLYLASILVFSISYVIYVFKRFGSKNDVEVYYASSIQLILSLVSQCLLCYIFS